MTVLLIGGAYQGKRELAKRLFHLADADFACAESCTAKQLASAKAVDGLHRYVRRLLMAGRARTASPDCLPERLFSAMKLDAALCRSKKNWRIGARRPDGYAATWRSAQTSSSASMRASDRP